MNPTLKKVLSEAAAVAVIVAAVLSLVAPLIPHLNLPKQDVAILTAVSGVVTAFVSWARSQGLVAKSRAFLNL